jgi:hypothetical protein
MGEENNTNNIILAVGIAITLCLVIIIIQGVYRQILASKRKRRSTIQQKEKDEIYNEIDDRALVGRPNIVNRRKVESSKERNKYNVINCDLELPGRGYQEIKETPDRTDVKSQGATDSDSNGESYLEPNVQRSAHTYIKVIDTDDQDAGPSSRGNYLDPVAIIHDQLPGPVLSDSSDSSVQYQDTVLPFDQERNRTDQNGCTFDKADALYLDVTNS